MVTWIRLAIINRTPNLYPQDYRGNWENTKEFYVFNTHFFNGRKDSLARYNAAKLILKKVNELNRFGEWTKDCPIYLMGDFNCKPGSKPYNVFIGNKNSDKTNLFKDCIEGGLGIDWILYKGNVDVIYYEKVDYKIDGVYPSDHKPVYVKTQIKE